VELERFTELEQRIKGIVEASSALKNRNQELERIVQTDAVRTKVDMLLDMLRDIESPQQETQGNLV